MKKIILLAILLFLVACESEKADPPKANHGAHYFYIENQLDYKIYAHFSITTGLWNVKGELPDTVEINRYDYVALAPGEKTLGRVFVGREGVEPLNCFEYDRVLLSTPWPSTFLFIKDSNWHSINLWKSEYWKFQSLDKWNSSYTMTVTTDMVKEVFK